MKLQSIDVTPEQAKKWLAHNMMNRPVRKGYVSALADAMQRGEWMVNHQAIAVNGNKLVDGQHRLMALLESGLPKVRMTVITDADAATFDTIDIGAKRTMADIYREDLHVIHPIYFIGKIVYGGRCTPRELRPIYTRYHQPIRELVALYTRGTKKLTIAPIKVGAMAAILKGETKSYVHRLFENLCNFEPQELPRSARSFLKQIMIGTTSATMQGSASHQWLVRAFTIFQRENADLERVMVKDVATRTGQIRQLFRDDLGIK